MNILELRRNEFIPGAGVVPVYSLQDDFVSESMGVRNLGGRFVSSMGLVVLYP